MKIIKVDRNYLQEVYDKVDKEILTNHKDKTGFEKDRLNALLVRMTYKGKSRHFAIPLKHNIKMQYNDRFTYYVTGNTDKVKKEAEGIFFKKCLPVDPKIIKEVSNLRDPFLSAKKKLDAEEKQVLAAFAHYLEKFSNRKEQDRSFRLSTSIDKIINFLENKYLPKLP